MLEKIGLPPKPSMRGGNWVVDASHCQGCASQFTFINRKHHCRRCGGLFCNSCTQQRMVLRGQGDSPVRICAPCKNLEEAARFELRHGHRNRASKGSSKQTSKHEEVLNELLRTEGAQSLLSRPESHTDVISDLLRTTSSPSASTHAESAASVNGGLSMRSSSVNVENHSLDDIGSSSVEELRQRAVDEKKKYKILRGEGKSEEALQAFKRGKELERQAAALEIQLRKNRRMASKASTLSSVSVTDKSDESEEPGSKKKKVSSQMGKAVKDDLAAELKELGWTDADIHDADKKPVKPSLEGELSKLLSELPRKASQGKGAGSIDRTQVTAHKRQALIFKREGKLAEAKEELKKAKILEKQIEEQELLGGAEDSDDELSVLINSMDDDDKQDDLLLDVGHDPSVDFHQLLGVGDDLAGDNNFEVTDDDMNDPELAAALQSFGWTEEDDRAHGNVLQSAPLDQEALMNKILALKREALSHKRAGNVPEAMNLLKKAKQLEKDLEDMQPDIQSFPSESTQKSATYQVSGETSIAASENLNAKLPPKNRLAIQRELLAIKKNALALRREGRIEEAEEELKKGKALENQLEEIETASKKPDVKASKKNVESNRRLEDGPGTLDLEEAGVDAEVTEQDMHDPALLSVLKNLGWEDEDAEATSRPIKTSKQIKDVSDRPSVVPVKTFKNKAEIQRELLALKRKALALRRQGKTEEADEELEKAKVLEKQMEEMETSHIAGSTQVESMVLVFQRNIQEKSDKRANAVDVNEADNGHKDQNETTVSDKHSLNESGPKFESWLEDWVSNSNKSVQSVDALGPVLDSQSMVVQSGTQKVQHKESLESSNLSQATTSVKVGDQITAGMQETKVSVSVSSVNTEQNLEQGIDIRKDEILAHKRKALALKREGKLAEAREELRQAKLLEKSLEEVQQPQVDSKTTPTQSFDDAPVVQEIKPKQAQKPLSGRERLKLQQESLAHKRNALKLRREGKIEESEAELELAKALESQLEEGGAEGSSSSMSASKAAPDDAVVEDLLDPQLMSVLKSIGWNDSDMFSQPSKKPEPKTVTSKSEKSVTEKSHLEEQIKNEKLRALNLKRAGNQAEALEALRAAKLLEKKLASLSS
ncbi:LOW QUALITY PROTEIN: uncharacterized protein LOC120278873 [Dioscorea cayenensis subsp. rotundata]|uniref:LOW QUALITY PROTEIN: uncharacterized protein LOC120278873 n=1 Tax=Dioscorea cayennensis subsp. rotundata TaxID=55577 RepID=A0AB40CU30_DIOCR|nr:LOW QUALITY PROTEIN: uncharacterized protein LOC120278873 [Dioscorea cayenensis subsp. rotundata]